MNVFDLWPDRPAVKPCWVKNQNYLNAFILMYLGGAGRLRPWLRHPKSAEISVILTKKEPAGAHCCPEFRPSSAPSLSGQVRKMIDLTDYLLNMFI